MLPMIFSNFIDTNRDIIFLKRFRHMSGPDAKYSNSRKLEIGTGIHVYEGEHNISTSLVHCYVGRIRGSD